jgi:hypothetical protein
MSSTLRLATGALFAVLAFAGTARAETRTLPAQQLVLATGIDEDTTIEPDPTLSGAIRISRDDGLDCLTIVQGSTVSVATARCDSDDAVRIAVPPGMPLVVNATGGGDIKIGDIGGPLTLSLSSHGDVTVGRTGLLNLSIGAGSDVSLGAVSGPATLTLAGSGDVKMQSLAGPLSIKSSGSGDVAIGSITSDSVNVEASGSGDVLIGGGSIGMLTVRLNGSADFATAATSRDADLVASGGGDMRVGPVANIIRRDASGGSDIRIGSSQLVSAVIADVAHAIGNAGNEPHHRSGRHDEDSGFGHFITLLVVGFLAYVAWRMVRRAGGVPNLLRRPSQMQANPTPTHAGVIALCDTVSRLDQRLGRVEAYVTSREFDLQQKFREMGRS